MPIRIDCRKPCASLRSTFGNGIASNSNYEDELKLYGHCQIDVPYKGVLGILIEEVLTPFYLFQVLFRDWMVSDVMI